jgi:hypothetical protein
VEDDFRLPMSATIVDNDGMKTHVLFSAEQTSVLQASRWTIERTALEQMRRLAEQNGVGEGEGRLTPQMIETDCCTLGIFGIDEIEHFVASFKDTLDKSAALPSKKRRGRPRKNPLPV